MNYHILVEDKHYAEAYKRWLNEQDGVFLGTEPPKGAWNGELG